MKATVIGASGLVGSHLMRTCQQRGWEVTGTYHNFEQPGLVPLKLTDKEGVEALIKSYQPDVIFLPAFRSSVDYCEQNPEETYQINVVGSLNVAHIAQDVGAKLVFYSSDYVFDGEDGPYSETDKPNPICVYGKQKLEIEQKIAQLLDDYLIVRVTVVYGHEAQGKNFVTRLVNTLKNGQTLNVPQDQVGSPTLVNDIAEASCRLVEVGAKGIFHVAGTDVMDRYQFAVKAAEVFELPTENIIPVLTPDLGQPAKRPLKAGMLCDKLVKTLNWNLRGINKGLIHLKETS